MVETVVAAASGWAVMAGLVVTAVRGGATSLVDVVAAAVGLGVDGLLVDAFRVVVGGWLTSGDDDVAPAGELLAPAEFAGAEGMVEAAGEWETTIDGPAPTEDETDGDELPELELLVQPAMAVASTAAPTTHPLRCRRDLVDAETGAEIIGPEIVRPEAVDAEAVDSSDLRRRN